MTSAPNDEALRERYGAIARTLDLAQTPEAWRRAFAGWDGLRREWKSWANITRLRYSQDTRSEPFCAAQRELDRRAPEITALDKGVKTRFLRSGVRPALEASLGSQAFALWNADVAAFDDAIADDVVRESDLTREYTELLAGASVEFEGESLSLGALGRYLQDPAREVRHAAERARWRAFEARAERMDRIFDELVRLRDGMARTLGLGSFVELGYRRMRRVDYGAAEVAAYRDEIAREVVPFAWQLVRDGAARAGLERAYLWDESALGARRRVAPRGDLGWIVARTREALGAIDPALGEFADVIVERRLFDVESRPNKALGAYCTQFPTSGEPFIFANLNGSGSDVRTLMHELGHAFQAWRSREKEAVDYLSPTYESAEIHSMALEYLSWPQMERFFEDGAAAYRHEHLLDAMLFLPYGAAVDHFQHLVYEHPGAAPADRHDMWREMERRYLPWREYGDLAFPAKGALWQEKRHIFVMPFYYIDYTLALCCALQFLERSRHDRASTLDAYVALCTRGGEAPFRELTRSAGLRSPFEAGALADVVAFARRELA